MWELPGDRGRDMADNEKALFSTMVDAGVEAFYGFTRDDFDDYDRVPSIIRTIIAAALKQEAMDMSQFPSKKLTGSDKP